MIPKIFMFILPLSISCLAQNSILFQIDVRRPIQKGLLRANTDDRIELRGSFNSWQNNPPKLEDTEGDSIYECRAIFSDTLAEIEYKFVIVRGDSVVIWEWNPDPDNPPYGNRRLVLKGEPQKLPAGIFKINPYDLFYIDEPVQFSLSQLRDDFIQLRKVLEEEHCCLYRYTGKSEFDMLFDRQFKLIDKPMAPHEFFRILAPISAQIGCGHSSLWMPGDYWKLGPHNLFPLQIRLIADLPVIVGSYTDSMHIPLGSVLTEIDNRPLTDIIKDLKKNYAADAYNVNFQLSQVERRFSMLYARMYGFKDSYDVKYILPDGSTSARAYLNPANIEKVRSVVFPEPGLNMKILTDKNTAILTITSFSYYDRVEWFRNFIDSCFSEIRLHKIANLILDLRKNDGGDPFCAVHLFAYLVKEPVPYFAARYGKYSEFADPIPLAKNNFKGNIYTLADGRCFSTNGHFCALLKYHHIGTMIGSETGANYSCNAATRDISLTNTGIRIFVPRQSFSAAVQGMDLSCGIMPDFPVIQTYHDFLEGKDTVLEYTLNLIQAEEVD